MEIIVTTPLEQLNKLARYLINNYGDIVRVDDMPNEDAVDEAIKILDRLKYLREYSFSYTEYGGGTEI